MKPPFCRPGSKKSIADKIIKMIPQHEIYVEPFVGSGAIYWKKEPSKKEVINDLHKQLMEGYKELKRTKTRNFRNDLDTVNELQNFVDVVHTTDGDKLTKSIIITCNTFGTKGVGKIYNNSNPYNKLKNIDEYQKRMDNTTILNQDYKTVIKKYDSPQTFFFLDPPYEIGSKTVYKKSFFNFEELNNLLRGLKGKFILTLNDSSNIRNIFKGFKITGITVPGKGGKDIGVKDRKELIIKNY